MSSLDPTWVERQADISHHPQSIRIGPVDYQIVVVENLISDDQKLNGQIMYNPSVIKLDEDMGPQMTRKVLWHETLHAILTHAGIDNEPENIVDALAYGIIAILRDNPWMRELVNNQDIP